MGDAEYYRYYLGFFEWRYVAASSEKAVRDFMQKTGDDGQIERITEKAARKAPQFSKFRKTSHSQKEWTYSLGVKKLKLHPLGFR